jgi:threonine dehydrogenase-like Zn-dependent dehydrogenase
LLYRFLGWEKDMPKFAHLPLLLKPDGKGKLSKRDGDRLALAEEFGAHHTINVEKSDPLEILSRLCPSGVDAVIETSGTPEGIRTGISLTRPGGRIVTIGLSGGLETPIVFDDLVWRSISIISGLGQAGNVADGMKLIETGRFPFEKINTHTYSLEELGQAVADTENRPDGFIKGAVLF